MRTPASRPGDTIARVEDPSCLGFGRGSTAGIDSAIKAWEIRRGLHNPFRKRDMMSGQITKAIVKRERIKKEREAKPKKPPLTTQERSEAAKRRWAMIPSEKRVSPFKLPEEERIKRRKESIKRAKLKHEQIHGKYKLNDEQKKRHNEYKRKWEASLSPEKREEYYRAQLASKAKWREKQRQKRIESRLAA